jgi:Domain of unknown function (DUF3883)
MSVIDPTGTDWTDREVDLIVADYFDMRDKEIAGQSYVKAQRNAALQELTGRSRGSIEFKHQNISAVLRKLGQPWITGYKPMPNFQKTLLDAIERALLMRDALLGSAETSPLTGFAEPRVVFFEAPPAKLPGDENDPERLKRLVRKFDPAARDARNRILGKQGEEQIVLSERTRLIDAGRADLSRKVRWVSEEDGDGAGYDILSFSGDGNERLLEVKTTAGHQTTPFFLSENERGLSQERPEAFRLVRLYDFQRCPRAFELAPPLELSVMLRATNYRASFEG